MVNNKWWNFSPKERGSRGCSDESAPSSQKSSESDDLPASQRKTPTNVQKKVNFQPN